jgi:hypothetical protein
MRSIHVSGRPCSLENAMQLLDWLRDGILTRRASYRHIDAHADHTAVRQERAVPSGRHDFGRRAHHTDPNARYDFGNDPTHRMVTPHKR